VKTMQSICFRCILGKKYDIEELNENVNINMKSSSNVLKIMTILSLNW